jgi:hypothetical protein
MRRWYRMFLFKLIQWVLYVGVSVLASWGVVTIWAATHKKSLDNPGSELEAINDLGQGISITVSLFLTVYVERCIRTNPKEREESEIIKNALAVLLFLHAGLVLPLSRAATEVCTVEKCDAVLTNSLIDTVLFAAINFAVYLLGVHSKEGLTITSRAPVASPTLNTKFRI